MANLLVSTAVAVTMAISAMPATPAGATDPNAVGSLSVVAGTGAMGSPTAGPATSSKLAFPSDVAVDASGNTYIADYLGHVVEKVTPDGTLSIFAGTGTVGTPTPGPATSSPLDRPVAVLVDPAGNVYIADNLNSVVVKVTPGGTLSIVVGTGVWGPPTEGPALSSDLYFPEDLAMDSHGNLYVTDYGSNVVVKVTPAGSLSIFAGKVLSVGQPTPGPATASSFVDAYGVAVDASDNVYVSDYMAHEVVKVTPDGTLSVFAGTGTNGPLIPGPATASTLSTPAGLTVDPGGSVYISDTNLCQVAKVNPAGVLSLVAGTGTCAASTPGPATSSNLRYLTGLAVDASGNLFIADSGNYQVDRVVVAFVPGAPTSVTATRGVASASIAFTAPPANRSSITSYRVTATDTTTPSNGGQTVSGSSSPLVVTGLTNGDHYTFSVTATNGIGTGPASSPSAAVVPGTVPGPPTGVSATRGNGSMSVAFTAPTFDGYATITSYTVTASDTNNAGRGGQTATGTSSPIVITGLTNGDNYQFRVTATNALGTGSPSNASSGVTAASAPEAPSGVTGTVDHGQSLVSWVATATTNGSAVTSYTASVVGNDSLHCTYVVARPERDRCLITGLADATTYVFQVTATNAVGTSSAATSSSVTTQGAPGRPTAVTGTVDHGQSMISWLPGSTNGSTTTSYTASVVGNASLHCTYVVALPETDQCLITGLADGTTYTFQVTATNAIGTGPAGTSAAVTTQAAPGAPTNVAVTTSAAQVAVTWTAPASDGASAITGYVVTAVDQTVPDGAITSTVGAGVLSARIRGLVAGDTYVVVVSAVNAVGTGPASAPSSSFSLDGPAAAVMTRITAKKGTLTAYWTAPPSKWGAIAEYLVSAQDASGKVVSVCFTRSGSKRFCTVRGLEAATTYTLSVVPVERRWKGRVVTDEVGYRSNFLSAST